MRFFDRRRFLHLAGGAAASSRVALMKIPGRTPCTWKHPSPSLSQVVISFMDGFAAVS